jgi:hypothetical protein
VSVRTTTAADAMAWMDLTVPYLDDSQNPDRDHVLFAFVMAVRAALGEAWGELDLFDVGKQMEAEGDRSEFSRIASAGQVYVARKVARRIGEALEQWLPKDGPSDV